MATEPAAVIRPSENRFGYFSLISSGYIMLPIATTVAGDEPETAPKNMQETSVVTARLPRELPTMVLAQFMIRLAISTSTIHRDYISANFDTSVRHSLSSTDAASIFVSFLDL